MEAGDRVDGSAIKLKGSFTCKYSKNKAIYHGRRYALMSDNGLEVIGNRWLARLGYMEQLKKQLSVEPQVVKKGSKKTGGWMRDHGRDGRRGGRTQPKSQQALKCSEPAGESRKDRAWNGSKKKTGRPERRPSNPTANGKKPAAQVFSIKTATQEMQEEHHNLFSSLLDGLNSYVTKGQKTLLVHTIQR